MRPWTSNRPATLGSMAKCASSPPAVTPVASKVTSMPVSTGTPVVWSSGTLPTTLSGRDAVIAHACATLPSARCSVNR